MFRIQHKIKCWNGNYWTTDDEWYEWKDTNEPHFDSVESACMRAMEMANNPYVLGIRVVGADNVPYKAFRYYRGIVNEVALS